MIEYRLILNLFIRYKPDSSEELENSRKMLAQAPTLLKRLEDKYRSSTGKSSLRIISGKQFGLLLEISAKERDIDSSICTSLGVRMASKNAKVIRYASAELDRMRIQYAEAEM